MPRRIFTITSKEDPSKKIVLNSLSHEEALEEALEELGWNISWEWNEPYKSMHIDEHMMSLWSQRSEYGKEIVTEHSNIHPSLKKKY